jgi:hypothetical protein
MISRLALQRSPASLLATSHARFSSAFTKVLVGNLPPEWSPADIQSRFSLVGPVLKVNLVKNK